jgi:hypothetical protein
LQATRVHDDVFDRTIDVKVLRLRRKLKADTNYICYKDGAWCRLHVLSSCRADSEPSVEWVVILSAYVKGGGAMAETEEIANLMAFPMLVRPLKGTGVDGRK